MVRRLSTSEFIKKTFRNRDNEYLDWTKEGRAIIVLHPASGYVDRHIHYFPQWKLVEGNEKTGKKSEYKVVRPFMVLDETDCRLCNLLEYMANDEGIKDDTNVLAVGQGSKGIVLTKSDLLGKDRYNWQSSIKPTNEFLAGVVDLGNPDKVYTLRAATSLSISLKTLIKSQIEDLGDEKGDPLKNPYPIKLIYEKDLPPKDRYSCQITKVDITEQALKLIKYGKAINFDKSLEYHDKDIFDSILKDCIIPDVGIPEEIFLYNSVPSDIKDISKNVVKSNSGSSLQVKTLNSKEKEQEPSQEMPPCLVCDKPMPIDTLTCPHCGTEYEESSELITCPFCASENPHDATKCIQCNQNISKI